jgi:hypothetical protein
MDDITKRLRKWSNVVPVPPAADTMQEAALEITGLRWRLKIRENIIARMHTTHSECSVRHAITDEERAAIDCFAKAEWTSLRWSKVEEHCATLRDLLERLK